jgi:hypothetical protein
VLFTLQALSSGHGTLFLLVGSAGLLLYRGALGEPLMIVRRVRDLGWRGVVLLTPALVAFLPYRTVQVEMNLRRSLVNWAPSPESFLAAPTHVQRHLLSWAGMSDVLDDADAYLFPGFVPLVLGCLALLRKPATTGERAAVTWRERAGLLRSDMRVFYLLLTIVCVLLSVGPPLGIWPFVYWLPGLNFIRVPSRFTILAVLGVAVLSAFGFERLTTRFSARARNAIALVTGLLLVLEFAATPLRVNAFTLERPAVEEWLNRQPKPFSVAEIPVARSERTHTRYMLHSMVHWQKTVHGYSGIRPQLHKRLYVQLRSFPNEQALATLESLGVDYLIAHTDFYPPGEWAKVEPRLKLFETRLRLVHAEDGGLVFRLVNAEGGREPGP